MDLRPQFGILDKDAEFDIDSRCLPHWFQQGVAVFITFRTVDSLPKSVLIQWESELRDFLNRSGVTIAANQPLPNSDVLPNNLRSEYLRQRERLWHWHLDSCHGDCALRQRELANVVKDTLLHFNGTRYDVASFNLMPNHVHLIAQFIRPTICRKQCTSWMHYSAHEINRQLNRSGAFWQSEPFDHLIRSDAQFAYLRRYIAANGRNAKLPLSDYLHWDYES